MGQGLRAGLPVLREEWAGRACRAARRTTQGPGVSLLTCLSGPRVCACVRAAGSAPCRPGKRPQGATASPPCVPPRVSPKRFGGASSAPCSKVCSLLGEEKVTQGLEWREDDAGGGLGSVHGPGESPGRAQLPTCCVPPSLGSTRTKPSEDRRDDPMGGPVPLSARPTRGLQRPAAVLRASPTTSVQLGWTLWAPTWSWPSRSSWLRSTGPTCPGLWASVYLGPPAFLDLPLRRCRCPILAPNRAPPRPPPTLPLLAQDGLHAYLPVHCSLAPPWALGISQKQLRKLVEPARASEAPGSSQCAELQEGAISHGAQQSSHSYSSHVSVAQAEEASQEDPAELPCCPDARPAYKGCQGRRRQTSPPPPQHQPASATMCHTSCSSGCQPACCLPSPCQATCCVPVSCRPTVCVPVRCQVACCAPVSCRPIVPRGAASPPAPPSSADPSPVAPPPAADHTPQTSGSQGRRPPLHPASTGDGGKHGQWPLCTGGEGGRTLCPSSELAWPSILVTSLHMVDGEPWVGKRPEAQCPGGAGWGRASGLRPASQQSSFPPLGAAWRPEAWRLPSGTSWFPRSAPSVYASGSQGWTSCDWPPTAVHIRFGLIKEHCHSISRSAPGPSTETRRANSSPATSRGTRRQFLLVTIRLHFPGDGQLPQELVPSSGAPGSAWDLTSWAPRWPPRAPPFHLCPRGLW
ncbi:hypothetical protein GHT09_015207 [Marmota monax]|uniref:Uncharacterized protein n=1 Tax=Marmota monax TaxID=9995 RepID=A0A834Q9I3_MARMO|nr:hypothetical protein GHT09_015207 [Marmota monax]